MQTMKDIKINKTSKLSIIIIGILLLTNIISQQIINLTLGNKLNDSYIRKHYPGVLSICILLQIFFIYLYIKNRDIKFIKKYAILGSIGTWIFCIGFIFL